MFQSTPECDPVQAARFVNQTDGAKLVDLTGAKFKTSPPAELTTLLQWARSGHSPSGSSQHRKGIRRYKEKFYPEWESHYLAIPAGHRLPVILMNIASLIAEGVKGIVRK